jgi:hypothetical protein
MCEEKSISRLEIAAWSVCSFIALIVGFIALTPLITEWQLVLVNGLFFAQPILFFVMTAVPRALKIVGALALCFTLYAIYTAVLSKIGIGPPMSGPEAKGSWFFYWMFCLPCGLVNTVFLGALLFGKLFSRPLR